MKSRFRFFFSALTMLFFAFASRGQSPEATLQNALRLKADGKLEQSLTLLQLLLKGDSSNVAYLYNTSFLLSKLGNRMEREDARQSNFRKAEYLAKKAIAQNPQEPEAHYTYALALGRINEFASSKQKVANAKVIKNECDLAIKLNPKHAGALHILGRWHREVAGFNFIERSMINAFFGGVPQGGSYDDAIECFRKSVLIEPNITLHQYELALSYYERGTGDDNLLCKIWCKKVLEKKPADPDEKQTAAKAKNLLAKVE